MKRLLPALALLVATSAFADPVTVPSDTIISVRQTAFLLSGRVFTAIKATVTSGADVKGQADNAAALLEWAGLIPTLFPLAPARSLPRLPVSGARRVKRTRRSISASSRRGRRG